MARVTIEIDVENSKLGIVALCMKTLAKHQCSKAMVAKLILLSQVPVTLQFLGKLLSNSNQNSLLSRWVVQAWNRKKGAPRNIYGRLETTSVFGTLLTSVKPSCGYAVIHPFQNRFLSVKEVARIQGFPDDYIFLAGDRGSSKPLCGMESLDSRFKQIGNSVSPCLATMIGMAQDLICFLRTGI